MGEAWFTPVGADGVAVAGEVRAIFRQAAYLRLGGQLVAVGSAAIPAGPLHLRTSQFSSLPLGVGTAVSYQPPGSGTGYLVIGSAVLAVSADRR